MTEKQIKTLNTIDLFSNILATIQIIISILIIKYGTDTNMKAFFALSFIVCLAIIIKSIFKKNQ